MVKVLTLGVVTAARGVGVVLLRNRYNTEPKAGDSPICLVAIRCCVYIFNQFLSCSLQALSCHPRQIQAQVTFPGFVYNMAAPMIQCQLMQATDC